jgi:hypothetical protein
MVHTTLPGARDAGLAAYQHENFGGAPELFSGDTPLPVSSQKAPVGADMILPGFSVVGWTGNIPGGNLVLANFVGGLIGDDGGVVASGAGTFGAGVGVADETITVGDVVYTLKAAPAAANEVKIGASVTESAANLRDAINADPDAIEAGTVGPDTVPNPLANATSAAGVVTVRANDPGTGGNAIATTETSAAHFSFGGGTLAGGADVAGGGIQPIGITTVDVTTGAGGAASVAIFTAGCFNPDALNWDDSFNTDEKREQAFMGAPTPTNIIILKPKFQPWDTV